jgi:hypothetical protein
MLKRYGDVTIDTDRIANATISDSYVRVVVGKERWFFNFFVSDIIEHKPNGYNVNVYYENYGRAKAQCECAAPSCCALTALFAVERELSRVLHFDTKEAAVTVLDELLAIANAKE